MAEALASVIEGASVSVKTMADGTLRLSIDIEPASANAAFMLFGAPGRAVALAALKDGAGAILSKSTELEPAKPKGGEWAKLAGIWCAAPEFWHFLNESFLHERFHNDSLVTDGDHAAEAVRAHCGISTRAQLDHDRAALNLFLVKFRKPFMAYMQKNGIVLGRGD